MKSCRVFEDSHVMLNNGGICASEVLDPLWIPNSSPFHGGESMVNFDQARAESKRCKVESYDDEFDGPSEKKRRLTAEQVRSLEKSFEAENKLEPDRKIQLAKDLGLLPRQVAIWFQNRRARCKTKLLEKEYDSLKSCYEKLKADYDAVFSDNEKLKNEIDLLRKKVIVRENDPISPLDFRAKDRSDNEIEAADSSKSDFSQDEDDRLVQRLCLPKLEVELCDYLQPNSCNLGFPAQNQGTWFWQY